MNRAGLTLIELIVAMAISGLVLSAGYAALSSMTELRRTADEATDAVARSSAARRSLVAWLGGARLTVEGRADFRGIDGERDGQPDDALAFLTTAPTPVGMGETLVRIFVDHDPRTPERGLVGALSDRYGTHSQLIEIEPRAAAMELRYLTGIAGDRQWLASWFSTTVLPQAVELALRPASGDSLPPLLRLPIIVPFSGGM